MQPNSYYTLPLRLQHIQKVADTHGRHSHPQPRGRDKLARTCVRTNDTQTAWCAAQTFFFGTDA